MVEYIMLGVAAGALLIATYFFTILFEAYLDR
jgi:hypothetical protein